MRVLNDFTTSVEKALSEIDPKWRDYEGLIICGTHNPDPESAENMILDIKEAREKGIPFLGICFGHQLAAIEYARNVLDIKDAMSEEWSNDGTPIVGRLPELKVGLGEDGESYWHQYGVHKGLLDSWRKPDNFITMQFHPEYQSSRDKPHPILVEFLNLCRK